MKHVIFFSHSSKDAPALGLLKRQFVEKTGGTVDVFLSSDGQSIPFGRNWVAELEKSLSAAKIAFVFVTKSSLSSNWVFFEAGNMFARGIKVIPIGLIDFDLALAQPPLSLLQGFNITTSDGLNNLIKVVNDEFNYTHKLGFQDADFDKIIETMSPLPHRNKYIDYVSKLTIPFNGVNEYKLYLRLFEFIENEKIKFHVSRAEIVFPSIGFYFNNVDDVRDKFLKRKPAIDWNIKFDLMLDFEYQEQNGILDKLFSAIAPLAGDQEFGLKAFFDERVEMIGDNHLSAGRFRGTGIELDSVHGLTMDGHPVGLQSTVDRSEYEKSSRRYVGKVVASCPFEIGPVPMERLRRFVAELFSCGVLRIAP